MVIVTYIFRGNPLSAHRLRISDKQQGIFYMHFPTDGRAHTTAFDGPIVDHWLEQKIAQTANESAVQDQSAMHEDTNFYS